MENDAKREAKGRSRLYPRYDLEESVRFIEVISKLGGSSVSSEAVAAQVGKATNNSTFIGRVSSSKQFDLIVQENGKLSLSPLGKEILYPRGESEKNAALKRAFQSPALYADLVGDFNGKVLPDQGALSNRLFHDYKIEAGAKDSAARNFLNSASYVGAIQNGILLCDEAVLPAEATKPSTSSSQSFSFANLGFDSAFTQEKKTEFGFNDSGTGWSLSIKSKNPLTSAVRKALVDLSELLEKAQD